jgi:hypothetical protein
VQQGDALLFYRLQEVNEGSFFTNVRLLVVPNNQLSALDVTAITNLEAFVMFTTNISNPNFTNLPNLKFIYASQNSIVPIDFTGFTTLERLLIGDYLFTSLAVLTNLKEGAILMRLSLP